ncbi:hypothetical protein AB6A40_006328 [Gnathostoma spinigerum]|uniref:Uncharacterized protein n=1 Tax=Gnathostoma spinigerum TaxID=75299 RepID=A0ABD6EI33_9BILA
MDSSNKNEQQERLMNGRGKANGTVESESFSKFLFNKEQGTCLGRTALSWSLMGTDFVSSASTSHPMNVSQRLENDESPRRNIVSDAVLSSFTFHHHHHHHHHR